MKLLFIIYLSFTIVQGFFNISPLNFMPNKTYSDGLGFSAIGNDGKSIYLSVNTNSTTGSIVKWDIDSNSNVSQVGKYQQIPLYSQYYDYVFFFKGYIIGCTNQNYKPCTVFNESTYAYLGKLSIKLSIGRGEYIQSKNIFAFGATSGQFGFFIVENLPNVTPVYLHNNSLSDFVFLEKSHDQTFVSVSFKNNNLVNIWRVSDWTLIKNITAGLAGVYAHSWSHDNKYLMIFMYFSTYIQIYDQYQNWNLVKNISIGYSNIRTNFYYQQTNVVVAFSENSKSVITINWLDYSISRVYSTSGWKMYQSDNKKMVTIFEPLLATAWFFNVNPYCQNNTVYDIPQKLCVSKCAIGCSSCVSQTCSLCHSGYVLTDGTCKTCPPSTVFNPATSFCDQCQSNCNDCSSSSICIQCKSGFNLVNASCIVCPTGTFYQNGSMSCQANCTDGCQSCASAKTCATCQSNYKPLPDGSCEPCPSQTYFNTSTSTCESCPAECVECLSSAKCKSCIVDRHLVNFSCVACPSGQFYNETSLACEANCVPKCTYCSNMTHCSSCLEGHQLQNNKCVACSNGQFYNSVSAVCQDCPLNCLSCHSPTQCLECRKGYALVNDQCTSDNSSLNENSNTSNTQNEKSTATSDKFNSLYEWTMGITVENELVALLNTLPGSRRVIRQLFAFFLNIDHLWLYVYHKREYGYYVNRLMQAVQNLEEEKWSIISTEFLNHTLNVNIETLAQSLNYKLNQTSYKFKRIEGRSSMFLTNNLDYFFLNVPLVLTVFFLFKFIFHLLFEFQVSVLFRQYAFYGYLLLMLMEGNCESFTYLFMYDSLSLNVGNFWQKVLSTLSIVMFLFFTFQLVAGFFIIKSSYDKQAKYFYDNCSDTLTGSACLLIENSLLNFCLGAAHIALENHYNTQLLVLFLVELLFVFMVLLAVRNTKVYEFKYVEWMNVLGSFLRMLLIFTYFCDQKNPGVYEVLDEIQMYIIIIYLFNWIFSALIAYFLVFYNFSKYFYSTMILGDKEISMKNKEKNIQIQFIHFGKTEKENIFNKDFNTYHDDKQLTKKIYRIPKFKLQFIGATQNQNKDNKNICKFQNSTEKNKTVDSQIKFDIDCNQNQIFIKENKDSKFKSLKFLKYIQQKKQNEEVSKKVIKAKSQKRIILNFNQRQTKRKSQQNKEDNFQKTKTEFPQLISFRNIIQVGNQFAQSNQQHFKEENPSISGKFNELKDENKLKFLSSTKSIKQNQVKKQFLKIKKIKTKKHITLKDLEFI